MSVSSSDFQASFDPTGYVTINGAQLLQLISGAYPFTDKGMIMSTDDVSGNPTVPDAATTTKWKNYFWRRQSATSVSVYVWNDSAATDATYLKWVSINIAGIGVQSIVDAMIADNTITDIKIASVSYSKISGAPSSIAPTGVAGGSLSGTYPNPAIADAAISTAKVVDLAITDAKLAASSVVEAKIAAGSVALTKLKADAAVFLVLSGSVVIWAGDNVPAGYLQCDGSTKNAADYPTLATALTSGIDSTEYIYGGTVAGGTFNLPDLRGKFIRGFDDGAGNDPNAATRTNRGDGVTGDNVGTHQADAFRAHTHTYLAAGTAGAAPAPTGGATNFGSGNTGSTGGSETRPINIYMMYIIKT